MAPIRYHDQLTKEQPQLGQDKDGPLFSLCTQQCGAKGTLAERPVTMLRAMSLWHSKVQCEVENDPDRILFLFSFNEESIKVNAL